MGRSEFAAQGKELTRVRKTRFQATVRKRRKINPEYFLKRKKRPVWHKTQTY